MTSKMFVLFSLLFVFACSWSGCDSVENVAPGAAGGGSGGGGGGVQPNVLNVTIASGAVCGTSLSNEPCASVTVCAPDGSSCQTISDILVDTGSFGLRIFSQALSNRASLQQMDDPATGNPLAECSQFGSTNEWGPVMLAQVRLAGETSVTAPVQVIDSTYSTMPASAPCSSSTGTDPTSSGFNGILGVGLSTVDCLPCATGTGAHYYYECAAGTCTETAVQESHQVQNPVALLPDDGNGVIMTFPALTGDVAASASGTLTFGIGTASDNMPTPALNTFTASQYQEFFTTFNATSYGTSFIDSGSNFLFIPTAGSGLSDCLTAGFTSFYCPGGTDPFSATMQGSNVAGTATTGAPATANFTIGDADTTFSAGDLAYDDIANDTALSATSFDWGMPFFYGRTVYVGIGGTSATINGSPITGPYWAF